MSDDIIELILEDHKPLKQMIKVLKNSDEELEVRQALFDEFCFYLMSHAKPEEKILYTYMKKVDELRGEGFEGVVEHALADQLLEEARRTKDEDLWSARVKVLAELVEHHIEEEENELLPDFKKHSRSEIRERLGDDFLLAKADFMAEGGDDAPSERRQQDLHA